MNPILPLVTKHECPTFHPLVTRHEGFDEVPQIPNLSAGFDDKNLSGSEHSLDEEFGIPSVTTPGVKKALQGMHEKLRRSGRHKNPVDRLTYDSYVARHCYMAKIVQDKEPTCFDEAIGNMKWEQAMDEEMAALDVNETWELVLLPEGKKSIGCKWVYKVKHNADGSISRYKARLVAKGYAQTYGIDYEETFNPVAKMAIVRTVIAVAASKGWLLHQMDVKNAFLHGDLQEEVYMEQPQGYEDVKHLGYVCKLKKALYGLKQAPRAWHARIVAYLVAIGFYMADADDSLYVRKNENGIVIVCIYVDDLIIGGDNEGEIMHRQYALDMLSKYGMADCKPISMPLDQNVKLRANEGQVLEDVTMYRQIVGSLIYLTISRRLP
ncbi:hypothetical protein L7F22_067209 [Adiantum nelumboides]|nr:hypothetical protein [Adiantum nelumboides]